MYIPERGEEGRTDSDEHPHPQANSLFIQRWLNDKVKRQYTTLTSVIAEHAF